MSVFKLCIAILFLGLGLGVSRAHAAVIAVQAAVPVQAGFIESMHSHSQYDVEVQGNTAVISLQLKSERGALAEQLVELSLDGASVSGVTTDKGRIRFQALISQVSGERLMFSYIYQGVHYPLFTWNLPQRPKPIVLKGVHREVAGAPVLLFENSPSGTIVGELGTNNSDATTSELPGSLLYIDST
jgi:hypothetical protein